MRFAVQVCTLAIGLPLEILIIAALLRGSYRRFPLLFLYAIVDFLTTVLEIPSAVDYARGVRTTTVFSAFYWPIEVLMQVLVFLVVISLIYQATTTLGARDAVRRSFIALAALFAVATFVIHYTHGVNLGSWMTPWTRDLSFCAAILDLGLWALLIGQRKRDEQLLMLSGGLGIQFAGEAIGESIRQLAIESRSKPLSLVGSIVVGLSFIVFLYIWWQALKAPAANRKPARPVTAH